MSSDSLRVGLLSEQLLRPVPGGIGTYVEALLAHLPRHGVAATALVALRSGRALERAGLGGAHRLPLPRAALQWGWALTGRPAVGGTEDLIHAPSLAFPAVHRRPLVVTVHDVAFLTHPETFTRAGLAFHRSLLGRVPAADLVISPSRSTADALAASAPGVLRVVVVPMGTDLRPPHPRRGEEVLLELGLRRPYVMWLGTLEPRKNLGGVLGGFAHALALLDDAKAPGSVQLLLVGPQGWRQEGLREAIERAGVAGRVRWIGWQPRERLAALYAGAEAFLFPSLVEGFGLPVLEAMACGTPVVTSDVSSLPEVAGDAALFCDPLDPTSIGKTLASVVADRAVAEDLAVRGRRRAAEFTWDRTARETAGWYRRVLGIEGEEVRER